MTLVKTAPAGASKPNGTATATKPAAAEKETPTARGEQREEKPVAPVKPITTLTTGKDELPPLDDRLHRLNQLFDLQGKYNRLLKSQQKLAEFKLAKGSENIVLTLEDEDNSKVDDFITSNPEVVKVVLECLQNTIVAKRKEIEQQLKW